MARIEKIIFIKDTWFTERDFERFGLEILKNNDFAIELWDAAPIFTGEPDNIASAQFQKRYPGYRVIRSMNELVSSVSSVGSSTWIHLLIPLSWSTVQVFRALSDNRNCSVQSLGALPVGKQQRSPFVSITEKMKKLPKLSVKRVCLSFLNPVLVRHFQLFGIRPVPVCMVGGEKALLIAKAIFPLDSSTSLVWVHAHDYDTYLKVQGLKRVGSKKDYGVFLDSNLPFHPDYRYSGEIPTCSEEEYFPSLNSFFSKVTEKYGVEILVAAHPTSDVDQYLRFFDRHRIFWGKTADLIHGAKFVINHQSTAINFAILFNKPVIFLTNDAINQSLIGPEITVMAESINKTVINIDKPFDFDLDREMEIDRQAYERYMRDYIKTPDSPDLPLWQIVADYLKKRS